MPQGWRGGIENVIGVMICWAEDERPGRRRRKVARDTGGRREILRVNHGVMGAWRSYAYKVTKAQSLLHPHDFQQLPCPWSHNPSKRRFIAHVTRMLYNTHPGEFPRSPCRSKGISWRMPHNVHLHGCPCVSSFASRPMHAMQL